jgi:ABC-type antimicrobial peptide transport system permease subunit
VVPFAQRAPTASVALLVRTVRDDPALRSALTAEVRQADSRLTPQPVQPLRALVEPQVRSYRIGSNLFVAFGGIALLLSAVGLYSVVAYDAAQRAREMGVRMALGARTGAVARLVVRDGLRSAGTGVAIGIAVALLAGGSIREFLFEVSPRDPILVTAAGVMLLAVALLATLWPAWRASRLDPMIVLREE